MPKYVEDEFEELLLTDAEVQEAALQAPAQNAPQQSYLAYFAYQAANLSRRGFIAYAGILGGSVAVYTVAPQLAARAVSYVLYSNPMAAPIMPVLSASVVASTFAVANKVTSLGTEAALDGTGIAMMYMYQGITSTKKLKDDERAKPITESDRHKLKAS